MDRALTIEIDASQRCQFVRLSADDLAPVPAAAVGVVTTQLAK